MKDLLFGTAGIPICCTVRRDTPGGIEKVRELGLGCMELEFVRGVYLKEPLCPPIKDAAVKNSVVLTCHAPYYINLNSVERDKIAASIQRIVESAKIASLCGAYSVTFHPGFYGKEKSATFDVIKNNIKQIMKELEGDKIWVRPETTGKGSVFGNFEECVKLAEEIEGVLPCIDFAHLHARTNGKVNSFEEIKEILAYYEKHLGKEALKNMHIHYSGINYTDKGERNHLIFAESDAKYEEVLRAWKEFNLAGCVINESPNIEDDAKMLQSCWKSI